MIKPKQQIKCFNLKYSIKIKEETLKRILLTEYTSLIKISS